MPVESGGIRLRTHLIYGVCCTCSVCFLAAFFLVTLMMGIVVGVAVVFDAGYFHQTSLWMESVRSFASAFGVQIADTVWTKVAPALSGLAMAQQVVQA